jgi:hypothetical protein
VRWLAVAMVVGVLLLALHVLLALHAEGLL